MAFCSQCGTRTIVGDRFCRQCGAALDEPLPTTPAPPPLAAVPAPHPPPSAQPVVEPGARAQRVEGWPPTGAPGPFGEKGSLLELTVEYPPRLSRLLIFVKWLLAVPHYLVLLVYALVFYAITFVAWWAILFTSRYPPALFGIAVRFLRYTAAVNAYLLLMRDEYPPFSGEAGRYPLHLEVPYPRRLSRGLIFVKWLLIIPNWLVLSLVLSIAYLAVFLAWFAILFTGRFPPGWFRFVEGALRWNYRAQAYVSLLTDRYPPFSTAPMPDAGRPRYAAA